MTAAERIQHAINAVTNQAEIDAIHPRDRVELVSMMANLMFYGKDRETAELVGEAMGPYWESHYDSTRGVL